LQVQILFKKDDENDLEKVARIAKIIQDISLELDMRTEIELTNDFRAFSHLATNFSVTPIVILNNHVEFIGSVPQPEKVREKLKAYQAGRDSSLME